MPKRIEPKRLWLTDTKMDGTQKALPNCQLAPKCIGPTQLNFILVDETSVAKGLRSEKAGFFKKYAKKKLAFFSCD